METLKFVMEIVGAISAVFSVVGALYTFWRWLNRRAPVAERVPEPVPVAVLAGEPRARAVHARREVHGPREWYPRPPIRPARPAKGSMVPVLIAGFVILSLFMSCGAFSVLVALAQAGTEPPVVEPGGFEQTAVKAAPSLVGTWTSDAHVLRFGADGTFTLGERQPLGEVAVGGGRYRLVNGILSTTLPSGQPWDESRIDWLSDNQMRTTYLRGPGQVGAEMTWVRQGVMK